MDQFPQATIRWEFIVGFAETWRLWLPLLLLLIWIGWLTRRLWGGRVLLASLLLLAIFAAKVIWRERATQRSTIEAWDRLRVPMQGATEIDGLRLAAGTMVRWDKEQHGHLLTADLGDSQTVAPNVVLGGEVSRIYDDWWRGILVHDSVIQGWHCAAGKLDWYTSGSLRWCVLSEPQKLPAGEIPGGTAVLLGNLTDPGDVLLHLPNAGMRVSPGNAWIAPDGWFAVTATGELKRR